MVGSSSLTFAFYSGHSKQERKIKMKILNLTAMALTALLIEKTTLQATVPTERGPAPSIALGTLKAACGSVNPTVLANAVIAINDGKSNKPEAVTTLRALNKPGSIGIAALDSEKPLHQICQGKTCTVESLSVARIIPVPEKNTCVVETLVRSENGENVKGVLVIPSTFVREFL
jgi:hypothetical protein